MGTLCLEKEGGSNCADGDVLDVKLKVDAATQLRDSLEHYTTSQSYPAFLKRLTPVFINLLRGQPVFISTNPEQVG
jgi:transformation/transcription domain-associated protein